jgi:hypothetical protein
MPDSGQQLQIEAPKELLADMPLPSDAKTFFLGGIFVLLMLTAAYVASDIALPMIFAVMLNLLICSRPCAHSSACGRPGRWGPFCSYLS